MIISIASGKGGTGKTTVSTNLAAAMGRDAAFLDCDVEEPNAHIFLKPKICHSEPVSTLIPKVDMSRCNLCRKCVDICQFKAITVVGKKLLIFEELCHSCAGCIVVCPQGAMTESSRELGALESGFHGEMPFHHGLMRIGEAMSPPLIKKLRTIEISQKHTIIDAPPGTSCPVIAAMHGVDFVVLVTEPTPFGLHDLTLAHETVQELGLPCGIVINRADLGDGKVEAYAAAHDIPILLKIPFQKEIAEMYSKGRMLVEESQEWKETFLTLFRTIESEEQRQRRVHA